MKRKHLAALGTSIALIAALTACSSGDADEPTTENEDTTSSDASAEEEGSLGNESGDSAEEESTEEDTSDSASAGSGEVDFTVDGEAVELTNPLVQCADGADQFAIAVTADNLDQASGDAFGAVLTSGDNPTVTSVALSRSEGISVAYTAGTEGSAEVSVDGDTYTITGSGLGVDINDPMSTDTVDFTFTVTCP